MHKPIATFWFFNVVQNTDAYAQILLGMENTGIRHRDGGFLNITHPLWYACYTVFPRGNISGESKTHCIGRLKQWLTTYSNCVNSYRYKASGHVARGKHSKEWSFSIIHGAIFWSISLHSIPPTRVPIASTHTSTTLTDTRRGESAPKPYTARRLSCIWKIGIRTMPNLILPWNIYWSTACANCVNREHANEDAPGRNRIRM